MTEIIVALIGIVGSIVTCVITNSINNKRFTDLVSYRLQELEKKQDIHNGVIERVYKIEQHNAVMDEVIKELKTKVA